MSNESLGRHISVISRYLNYYINNRVEKYKINKQQVEILTVLYRHEGISQNKLGEILKLDKITITKSLRGLLKEGYIEKMTHKVDKRVNNLFVTKKGHQIRQEIENILIKTTNILSRNFTDEENLIIRQLLTKMSTNIYQEVNHPKV